MNNIIDASAPKHVKVGREFWCDVYFSVFLHSFIQQVVVDIRNHEDRAFLYRVQTVNFIREKE